MRRSQRTQGGATPKNFDKWMAQTRRMAKKDIRKKPKADGPRRTSKRNSAKATPSPKNFEQMLQQAESLAIESLYEEACAKKIKHTGSPFRLLDLPPELRMMIFDYMVFKPHPLQLENLVAPLITAISKQVRAECMARFFALNTFQMTVDTNICLLELINLYCDDFGSLRAARQSKPPNTRDWIDVLYALELLAGKIWIRASSEEWLEKIDPEVAVFRNLRVDLQDTLNYERLCASNPNAPTGMKLAWVLQHPNPKGRNRINITVWHPRNLVPHFVSRPVDRFAAADYHDLPVGRLSEYLDGEHDSFRTFNLGALKHVAYAIGHWGVY